MTAYKPYKRVPLARRCPHGLDVSVCGTCVGAKKDAQAYWHRVRDKENVKDVKERAIEASHNVK